MNTKKLVTIAVMACAIGCVVLSTMALKRQQAALTEAQQQADMERHARDLAYNKRSAVKSAESPTKAPGNPLAIETPTGPTNEDVSSTPILAQHSRQDITPQKLATPKRRQSQKASALDPLAREALSLVGNDSEAEEYWAQAINNPDLPEEERKDLIEDLNEDGLSDPKHPGPEDLPLILNRIEIIQELAPDAMDQVNADAFAEAYKDLVDMLNGRPVR